MPRALAALLWLFIQLIPLNMSYKESIQLVNLIWSRLVET